MQLLGLMIGAVSLQAGILTFGSFTPVPGTEGAQLNGTLASFSDSNIADTSANLTGTIDWGDGTAPTLASVIGSAGTFSLSGAHIYNEEGSYTATLSVTDGVGDIASATGTEVVADTPLTPDTVPTVNFTPGVAMTNVFVATFTDGDPNGSAPDFTATINWGDATTSFGDVIPNGPGVFSVEGTHTYAASGDFTVLVAVHDVGGASTTSTTTAFVSSTPEPGSIGMVLLGFALAGVIRMRRA